MTLFFFIGIDSLLKGVKMFGFRVEETVFLFSKEMYTKEFLKPHEFEADDCINVDLDNFSIYVLDEVTRVIKDLGYNISQCKPMWLASTKDREYLCLVGTRNRVINRTFTIYCYEK